MFALSSCSHLKSSCTLSKACAVPRASLAKSARRPVAQQGFLIAHSAQTPKTHGRSLLITRAADTEAAKVDDDDDDDSEGFFEAVAMAGSEAMTLEDLKAALLDSLYGTERGLSARSEVRAEINELISQMEAKNPTPSPTEALEQLDGDWKLVYTSNSELMAVLALSKLPFVEVGDVTQKIDATANMVENRVMLTVPFSRTSFSTTASFEVRSPKRLQLRLTKGGIHTPELMTDFELPSNMTVMGQALDLSQLKDALVPISERVQGLFGQVNNLLSQIPDPQVNIEGDQVQTWQLNTYVDEDTRVARGDGGSVFIYVKEVTISSDWEPAAAEPEQEQPATA